MVHVEGKVDPLSDIEVINTELALADLDTVEKAEHRVGKLAKGGDKEAKAKLAVLGPLKAHLDEGHMARAMTLDDDRGRCFTTCTC